MSRLPRSRVLLAALVGLLALPVGASAYDAPAPSGASPLRYRDAVFPNVSVSRGLTYGQVTSSNGTVTKLLLDLYQPVGDTSRSRPVMIWVHGGYFAYGSRTEGAVSTLAQRFAQRGYVTASIDYRLLGGTGAALCTGGSTPPSCFSAALAATSDAKQSVQWFRRYASALRIDPTRISMGGTSAGAITSVLAAASPAPASGTTPSSTITTAFSISGGSPTNIIFNPGDSSVYFWHGTADTIVPIDWARSNLPVMQSKGILGVIHEIPGAGHVPFGQYGDDMDTQARNWVYDQMDLELADQRGFPGAP